MDRVTMNGIRIVETTDAHVEGFHRCVGVVARERRYIGLVDSPPLAASRSFFQSVIAGGGAHYVAVAGEDDVVGWCDIVRFELEGFRHVGRLGMGLLPHVRGHGVGQRLAQATIDAARRQGIERIELEVFASNTRAIRLYERLGFMHEGVRVRARKLDGEYDDNVLMALVTS
jgi:RimJ/RimL family protein N-acetyltransferase